MDSYFVLPVIQNTIKSWYYMNLFWTRRIIKRTNISLMHQKYHQRYYINFLMSEYLSFNWQNHTCYWWNEKVVDGSISRFFKSIYLKYVKFLQSGRKSELSISNKMGQHVFRYRSMIIYSLHFFCQLHNWFILCFLLYVVNIHLLWRGGDVGRYCKLIPNWIKAAGEQLNQIEPSMNITRPI